MSRRPIQWCCDCCMFWIMLSNGPVVVDDFCFSRTPDKGFLIATLSSKSLYNLLLDTFKLKRVCLLVLQKDNENWRKKLCLGRTVAFQNMVHLWYFSQCWSEPLRFLMNSEVWTLNWKRNVLPSCMIQNGAWQSILYWIGTWSPSQIIQNLAWQSLWSQTRSKFIWSEIDEKPDKGGGRIALSAPTQARSASPDKNQIQTSS